MAIQAPKGTRDVFGAEMRLWRQVETEIRALTDAYGYTEIRTPLFEHTELYLRGVGDTTDIVQKEMYTFNDKAGRSLSLRPELTAGVARAYVENGMKNNPQPTKLWYIGPNFRYENPQAGRYRQHYQFGVELFGAYGPAAEAEIISLGHTLLSRLGISDATLHINSIGCPTCRSVYQQRLRDFLGGHFDALCPTCRQRFEKNPLRTLDCKVPSCRSLLKDAPSVLETLDDDCRAHFDALQTMLTALNIPFAVDPRVVRGLDYYTRTVFEFIEGGLTVIGGGRYDGLMTEVGGEGMETAGAGFGMGMERLVMRLQKQDANPAGITLFVGHADETGFREAQRLTFALRKAGVSTESELLNRSVKAQMKYAGKIGAKFSTVLGGDEVTNRQAAVKNMADGERHTLTLDDAAAWAALLC